jgi:hypothetical protein
VTLVSVVNRRRIAPWRCRMLCAVYSQAPISGSRGFVVDRSTDEATREVPASFTADPRFDYGRNPRAQSGAGSSRSPHCYLCVRCGTGHVVMANAARV